MIVFIQVLRNKDNSNSTTRNENKSNVSEFSPNKSLFAIQKTVAASFLYVVVNNWPKQYLSFSLNMQGARTIFLLNSLTDFSCAEKAAFDSIKACAEEMLDP